MELYTVRYCPVPCVANNGQNKSRSLIPGIIFSIPAIAIWILGNDIDKNAFPSFSVTAIPPISAIKKLAPLITISALINLFLTKSRCYFYPPL